MAKNLLSIWPKLTKTDKDDFRFALRELKNIFYEQIHPLHNAHLILEALEAQTAPGRRPFWDCPDHYRERILKLRDLMRQHIGGENEA